MIREVAQALGDELLQQVLFAGGSATGLLVNDRWVRQRMRYTEDVDLIVTLISGEQWYQFEQQLVARGFTQRLDETVICRYYIDQLAVDFMPDDSRVLGFSNRWYADAVRSATAYALSDELTIPLITSPYFLATKLDAYTGRGDNDPLSSHDCEDIVNLIDGRATLVSEVAAAPFLLQQAIAEQLQPLLANRNFEYLVQSSCQNREAYAELIFTRIEALITGGSTH
ncbi:MAG: hypothetical protein HQL48_10165 [Gammaproteobacteria bacterium]|nr:hypothetical protein [Gammaproteobacteria bacterium]